MTREDSPDATVRILARYKDGDAGAVNALYDRYFDRIHAVVRMRMGPQLRAKAESVDIVQEAFLASLRGLDNFRYTEEGDFLHWLSKITENRIRDEADYFRAQKRDQARERPLHAGRPSRDSVFGPINELARHTTPATQVARAEEIQRLEEAMDALPQLQREALLLVRYEGLSLQAAGEKLGKTPDAVRMLMARAIVALGKKLGAAAGES